MHDEISKVTRKSMMPKVVDSILSKSPSFMFTENPHLEIAKWVLDKEKQILGTDFPWFSVKVFRCKCGCKKWMVTLTKKDIGYVKDILSQPFDTPLEAHIKFEKLVKECEEGRYHGCTSKEGETLY